MFAGINMFWARLRLILARAAIIIITINITLEGTEKIKTQKNDNKTLWRIFFSPALYILYIYIYILYISTPYYLSGTTCALID